MVHKLKIINFLQDFGCTKLKQLQILYGDKDNNFNKEYDLNKYIDKLKEKLANKTIINIISVFKSILRYAERKYNIDFKLDLISCPTIYQKEIEVFSNKEKSKLEKYLLANQELKNIGILISLYSGLRIGETS